MAGKTSSKSDKAYHDSYKSKYEKNRVRRLNRHIKSHPNDSVAVKALGNAKSYRRQDPISSHPFNVPFHHMKEADQIKYLKHLAKTCAEEVKVYLARNELKYLKG
jgi:hypothetical protein